MPHSCYSRVMILAFWLNKCCALGDWKFKNAQCPFNDEGIDFFKEIFFLKSQNVHFFNFEMCCDNDLFMILNFLKNVSVSCGIFHVWMCMHTIVIIGCFYLCYGLSYWFSFTLTISFLWKKNLGSVNSQLFNQSKYISFKGSCTAFLYSYEVITIRFWKNIKKYSMVPESCEPNEVC